jgi:hypothetical protein
MYSHCIFCTSHLGANEALADCPVGRTVAFDPQRGRLWIVCPRCDRWNLAPLLERWEAVEQAERRFRASRLRASADTVGVATLPDGTQLVRVGAALPGEIAAWRYGRELRRRRLRHRLELGASLLLGLIGPVPLPGQIDRNAVVWGGATTAGHASRGSVLRRRDLRRVEFVHDEQSGRLHGRTERRSRMALSRQVVQLEGAMAEAVLARMMVSVNRAGPSPATLQAALALLDAAGSAGAIVSRLGAPASLAQHDGFTLRLSERLRTGSWRAHWRAAGPRRWRAPAAAMLALEMALHEETERAALAGELRHLELRWRQAEEIAAIADSL